MRLLTYSIAWCAILIIGISDNSFAQPYKRSDPADDGPTIQEILGTYVSLDARDTLVLMSKKGEYFHRLRAVDSSNVKHLWSGEISYENFTNSDDILPPKAGRLGILIRHRGYTDRYTFLLERVSPDGVIQLSPWLKRQRLNKTYRRIN